MLPRNSGIFPYADLIKNPDVEIVRPGTPGAVTIVRHVVNNPSGFEDILKQGLKSREMLAQEGKMVRLEGHLPDYNSVIYFRSPHQARVTTDDQFICHYAGYRGNWVSVDVNPANTYAYDGNCRINDDYDGYLASRTRLQDLLDRPQLGSWEVIVQKPIIAPQWFSSDSRRFRDGLQIVRWAPNTFQ